MNHLTSNLMARIYSGTPKISLNFASPPTTILFPATCSFSNYFILLFFKNDN